MRRVCQISGIALLILASYVLVWRVGVYRIDQQGRTPQDIHAAAAAGDITSIRKFLDQGIDVDHAPMGLTPAQVAVLAEQDAAARFLISCGAKDDLLVASGIGDDEMVRKLLDSGVDVNVDEVLGSPLVWASRGGHLSTVELLISRGADVNKRSAGKRTSALHEAASRGYADVARYLISKGGDPDIRNDRGRTPLHEAAISNRLEVAEVLLSSGSRPDLKDDAGCTPLLWACNPTKGTEALVELLISAGADPTVEAHNGSTPLSEARRLGRTDLAEAMESVACQ